jgi:hypothetical protein
MFFLQKSYDSGRELLKLIAIITMTIDHIGAVFFPNQIIWRVIGRISFPIFCYLIILGIETTKNPVNYFKRLLFFAFLSQIPYFLALNFQPFESLNIFFTLSFGVLFILFYKKNSILVLFPVVMVSVLNFDYSLYGLALIGSMYLLRKKPKIGLLSFIFINFSIFLIINLQIFTLFSIPLILLYQLGIMKKERKIKEEFTYSPWRKYFFYLYYPLHLILIYLASLFLI